MLVQLGVRKADESEDDDEEEDEAADYLHALLSTKEEEPQETKEMKLKLNDLMAGDKRKGIGSSAPDEAKRLKTEAVLPSAKRCKLSEKEVVDVIHASPKMSIKQLIAKFKEFLTDKEDKDQFMRIVKVRLPKSRLEFLGSTFTDGSCREAHHSCSSPYNPHTFSSIRLAVCCEAGGPRHREDRCTARLDFG